MNRNLKTTFKAVLCAGVIVAGAAAARAQIEVNIGFPDAGFIATASPVMFGGHAVYLYGGRWYYRDGRSWRTYRDEPAFLRDRRMHHEPERKFYGRAHGGGFVPVRRDDHRRR